MDNFMQIVNVVARLQPGQRIAYDRYNFGDIEVDSFHKNSGPSWNAADRIMENIIGSAFTHRYFVDWNGTVTFERIEKPLPPDSELRTYVSPDRRDLFEQQPDGFWRRK